MIMAEQDELAAEHRYRDEEIAIEELPQEY